MIDTNAAVGWPEGESCSQGVVNGRLPNTELQQRADMVRRESKASATGGVGVEKE